MYVQYDNENHIYAATNARFLFADQNIESPPSIRPVKKYCDITGLDAKYTDPKTGLRYHNAEVYQFIKSLGVSSVQAYLGSRNAAVVLK